MRLNSFIVGHSWYRIRRGFGLVYTTSGRHLTLASSQLVFFLQLLRLERNWHLFDFAKTCGRSNHHVASAHLYVLLASSLAL